MGSEMCIRDSKPGCVKYSLGTCTIKIVSSVREPVLGIASRRPTAVRSMGTRSEHCTYEAGYCLELDSNVVMKKLQFRKPPPCTVIDIICRHATFNHICLPLLLQILCPHVAPFLGNFINWRNKNTQSKKLTTLYISVRVNRVGGVELLMLVYQSPQHSTCLLYTSPSPRDGLLSRMPSSA